MWHGVCPWCGGGGGYGFGFGGWLAFGLMMFFGLLVLIGIILLVVWAVRSASGGGGGDRYGRHGRDPAVEAARERYARGEISREELEAIERDLRR